MQFVKVVNGNHYVTEESRTWLSGIKDPISIVSMVGAYRSGKSYLLNRLNGNSCFITSSNVNAQTRGIWLSDKILNDRILLMDTEGLGNVEVDQNHDANIFVIALLVSSMVIHNSIGAIKQNTLDELHLVGKISEIIRSQCPSFVSTFPTLMFTLRDFDLKLVDTIGKSITPDEYIEMVLEKTNGQLARSIRDLFSQRSAVCLPRPASNTNDLQGKTTEDFDKCLETLRSRILSTPCKTYGNNEKIVTLNGPLLLNMVDAFCNILNTKEHVPTIPSIWQCVVQDSVRIALQCIDDFQGNSIPKAMSMFFNKVMDFHALRRSDIENAIERSVKKHKGIDLKDVLMIMDTTTPFNIDNNNNNNNIVHAIREKMQHVRNRYGSMEEENRKISSEMVKLELTLQETLEHNKHIDNEIQLSRKQVKEHVTSKLDTQAKFDSVNDENVQLKSELMAQQDLITFLKEQTKESINTDDINTSLKNQIVVLEKEIDRLRITWEAAQEENKRLIGLCDAKERENHKLSILLTVNEAHLTSEKERASKRARNENNGTQMIAITTENTWLKDKNEQLAQQNRELKSNLANTERLSRTYSHYKKN